ncbi:MAG TPA: hypothetical protein VFU11_00915, partial [Solirubrobacterales bacterium]|nr:hypothetical protein [Solirubrobacterales bacterium]
LTPTAAEGMQLASDLAKSYDLLPVPVGALSLGMVWRAGSGAALALLEEAELSHPELLDLLQDELLGGRLENLDLDQFRKQGASVVAAGASPDEDTSTASVRPLAPPPDLSSLPAQDPVLRQLLEDAEPLGRRHGSGSWLFAQDDRLLELHDLSGVDEPGRRRAVAEASLQMAFEEIPGAVPALSVDEKGDWLMISTPRYGEDMGRHLAAGDPGWKRLSAPLCGKLIAEAALSLDAMHERGLVHRDVRPGTLVFDPAHDEMRLAGFAIGTLLDERKLDRYRSPESFEGEIGPAIDQYALGVVARELLTVPGSPPLTEPVRRVLQKATAPRPGDRFPTTADFGSHLVEAIETETPRSLAERVAGLSPAKRAAMAPTAMGAVCGMVLLTLQAPSTSETAELVLVTSLLAQLVVPMIIFGAVALAGGLRRNRRFLSVSFAARPWVPLIAVCLLFVRGLAAEEDAYATLMSSFLYAYAACALLAPARPNAASWLIRPLAAWERQTGWTAWGRRLAKTALVFTVVAVLLAPTISKALWNNFDFPTESARHFGGPLTTVWNLRAKLGRDETADACDELLTAAAARDRRLCRQVAHLAGAVQRNDPASRRKDVFGAPGTFESFQVQELPAPPNHRFWMLWTPQDRVAGWFYTRGPNAQELIVMVTRRAPSADPDEVRSTWLYEVVWNGREWRVAEYRACTIGAPGTGKRPADCAIASDLSRQDLRKASSEERETGRE